jgi:hypothetical protein
LTQQQATLFADTIAIGFKRSQSSVPEKGVVAIGYDDLKRQLRHLANALKSNDALNVQSLKFRCIETMLAQISDINVQLDIIKVRIDDYEFLLMRMLRPDYYPKTSFTSNNHYKYNTPQITPSLLSVQTARSPFYFINGNIRWMDASTTLTVTTWNINSLGKNVTLLK